MIFLLAIAIISLYVVPLFTTITPTGIFNVSLWVALGAALAALASIVLYIVSPKEPSRYLPIIAYSIFTATVGLLVVQTGGASSPFIALWLLVAFFGGIFALWATLPILIASGVFVAVEYLDGNFSIPFIATVSFTSIIPLVIGLLIWREHDETEASRDNKSLATELSEVATRSEIIINAIGDGVVAVDSQGIIQLINPAAQEILGWGKQDALQLHYKSILQLADQQGKALEQANDPIMQVLNTNQMMRSKTLTVITKTKKKITSSIVVSPIGAAGSGVIAVFRDTTKETAEEREQAEFISTASHEMRTPVASIEGYLGLALNPNTAQIDDKARDFIMKAHEAAQHLGRLFQDLLDVSKSEDGRLANAPKVVDLVPFTETIVQGLQQKATEKGLQLIFKPTDNRAQKTIVPVTYVNQDNDHIREILDNLIENGIKYTPEGSITVDVNGTDEKVVVSVKDSGLGIPTEDVSHLFQKFYRVDNADRQAIGGTGLGLYLSRRLAEAMQGRLWVESVHGQGSTFFLELPRIDGQKAEELKQEQAVVAQAAAQAAAAQPAPAEPEMPPVVSAPTPAPAAPPVAGQTMQPVTNAAKAATTVPRGESLSREQIAAQVRKLEALARESQAAPQRPAPTPQPRQQ